MRRLCRSVWAWALVLSLSAEITRSAEPDAAIGTAGPSPHSSISLPYWPPPPVGVGTAPGEAGPLADPALEPDRPPPPGPEIPVIAPTMIGDLGSPFVATRSPQLAAVKIPFAANGAFKIADNESPRPLDRLFITYSYFNDVFTGTNESTGRLHEEVFGLEKTLLDGYASIGVRAPLFQMTGEAPLGRSDFGDLSIVTKYAWINNTRLGNALSTGLVVTVPTGPTFRLPDGSSLHPVILQPYVGGIFNAGRLYVHGFTSLPVPTDSRDAVLLFNDLGIGYRLYQGSDRAILRYVIPTVETHINTPLSHRGSQNSEVAALDEVVFTYGIHVGVCRGAQLTVGVATPVTGPLPYDLEAFAQFNWRF
jgi:hypothetical protein